MNPFRCSALPSPAAILLGALLGCSLGAQDSHAIDVVVTTLDGEPAHGELLRVTNETITLEGPNGTRQIPTGQTHWLRTAGDANPPGETRSCGAIELVSGTLLPIDTITLEQELFQVSPCQPIATRQGRPLKIPRGEVGAYVFRVGSASQQEQWRHIQQHNATADLIVVKRKSGTTLDYVEGIVTSIDEEQITVSLDGESVGVPLAKIYGVVCFQPAGRRRSGGNHLRIVAPGAAINADSLSWSPGGSLELAMPEGARLSLPAGFVSGVDFSRGGVVSLDELPPTGVDWRPLHKPPCDEQLALAWGRVRRGRSYSDRDLSLSVPNKSPKKFASGIAIRTYGEVTYTTPKSMTRLRATVGIDPQQRGKGRAVLRIEEDGRTLFEQTIQSNAPPVEIDLPVTQGAGLRIVVDHAAEAQADVNLHLCRARFTR